MGGRDLNAAEEAAPRRAFQAEGAVQRPWGRNKLGVFQDSKEFV